MRVAVPGTFIFCKGSIIVDGWGFELTEPDEEVTHEKINKCILDYLHANMVDIPNLEAQKAALATIEKLKKGPGGA